MSPATMAEEATVAIVEEAMMETASIEVEEVDKQDFWVYIGPVGLYNVLATREVRGTSPLST